MSGLARALLAALACAALAPAWARAAISDTQLIDGPSADVLDVGGVAMTEDGTAGIVYRKRVDGRAHVFAALFRDGAWGAPRRVDAGQAFVLCEVGSRQDRRQQEPGVVVGDGQCQ